VRWPGGSSFACLVALLAACSGGGLPAPLPSPQALPAVEPAPAIVLDQFGYRPDDPKHVRIRRPQTGFDKLAAEMPRPVYFVRKAGTNETVRSFDLDAFSDEPADPLSGDQVWLIDISPIREPGDYFVASVDDVQISGTFSVAPDVYKPVLREAFRTFYYQRAGFEKAPPAADARFADAASHLGPGQDAEARSHLTPDDARTARDLRGGWYDAGDYNQYTNWTAGYCRTLLLSYLENPGAWGDDFGIPESGNGVSDLLDEVKWGLDWLLRMQSADGSVLALLGRDAASPPSAAKGPSRYGPPSTSATLSAAGTFALASIIFGESSAPGHAAHGERLRAAALAAWQWAEANPNAQYFNADPKGAGGTLGAGEQEIDAEYLAIKRLSAAAYLYALTGDEAFSAVIDTGLPSTALFQSGLVDVYRHELQDALVYLARAPEGRPELTGWLADRFAARLNLQTAAAYGVPVDALHWGSNAVMANTGSLYLEAARLSGGGDLAARFRERALDYLHYLHGANPLGKAYLTDMRAEGAEAPVMAFYHSWQTDPLIPGFLVGGPNPTYDRDACCPDSCGNPASNAACGTAPPAPPHGQPPLKSYRDFNSGWPLNSWQVSENSNGYQAAYLRLLANFVE
jgi:endoglucanase